MWLRTDSASYDRSRIMSAYQSQHGNMNLLRLIVSNIARCNRRYKIKLNQLHAVSRTLQGRQRKPSVKTLLSPLSNSGGIAYCVRGRTQRRALPRHQSEEMKI